jgi:hypothetical protein
MVVYNNNDNIYNYLESSHIKFKFRLGSVSKLQKIKKTIKKKQLKQQIIKTLSTNKLKSNNKICNNMASKCNATDENLKLCNSEENENIKLCNEENIYL